MSTATVPPSVNGQYTEEDLRFMRMALQVAERALHLGEVPVGCVLVLDNPVEQDGGSVVVSHGANQVNATRDATRHAEIVALDRLLTGGMSSDALRLPATVLAQSARTGSLPPESPLLPGNQDRLEDIWQDKWHTVQGSNGNDNANDAWKKSYGWGTGKRLGKEDLSRCRLYVTCEPCLMCAAALAQVGIVHVFFGCRNPKFGGCGTILSLHQSKYAITEGLLADEAISLLQQFYNRENFHAPADKRKRKDAPPAVENDDNAD